MSEPRPADRPRESERPATTSPVRRRAASEDVPPEEARPARRPAPTAQPAAPERPSARLRMGLATPASLRAALLAREILGPPKALQRG